MLSDPLYSAAADRTAVLVAVHSLSNFAHFRDAFLTAGGLHALCALLAPPQRNKTIKQSQISHHSSASRSASVGPRGMLPFGVLPNALSNAAIRTIAKLMVCSVSACAISIETTSLNILAKAAMPTQPMDIRLRAAAGLAAIAAWSGPRRAVEIVETDHVVEAMSAILSERDERIPTDLRTATIDGIVVMSFRRHARRVLQKFGCEEKIRAAARFATVSGDYTAAARSTVAAGQLSGRSVDEYGFLVEDGAFGTQSSKSSTLRQNGLSFGDDPPGIERKATGLLHIQQRLLEEEPYASVEDLDVLQEIVHEEAGVLSSSPRDRNYVRRAARTYGISADDIEFISAMEDDAPINASDHPTRTHSAMSPRQSSSGLLIGKQDVDLMSPFSVDPNPNGGQSSCKSSPASVPSLSRVDRPTLGFGNVPEVENRRGASPRRCSNFMLLQDPDFDRSFHDAEEEETASNTTGPSSKSKILSPLLMFSSATKKAAERDGKNMFQKTNSQLSRETENERLWKEVIEGRPDMLRREHGSLSRVIAYRELALIPVPPPLRRKLWPILLDTASLREARPGLYRILCSDAEDINLPDDIEHTIEADVTRTMPLHSLFWAGGAQVGVKSLRSILRAYARYVPEVGYCQGMSSIAAVFLMNAVDEEEAFLMMVMFMSRFQYKKVFAPGFPLLMQWIEELKPLIAHYMPQLNELLLRENVEVGLYADKWLITALSHNFPHRYLLRVWDLMFLGGSPKIILKACLAVLKRCEAQLMTMHFDTMMPFLQRGFADADAGILDAKNAEPFITEMREFRFMTDIPKSQLRFSTQSVNNTQTSRNRGREGRSGATSRSRGSCLPCFRRSATVD